MWGSVDSEGKDPEPRLKTTDAYTYLAEALHRGGPAARGADDEGGAVGEGVHGVHQLVGQRVGEVLGVGCWVWMDALAADWAGAGPLT